MMSERKPPDWPAAVETVAALLAVVAIAWAMAWMVVNL